MLSLTVLLENTQVIKGPGNRNCVSWWNPLLSLISPVFFSMSINIQRSSNPVSDLRERSLSPHLSAHWQLACEWSLLFFLHLNVKWGFWVSRRKTSQDSFHGRAESPQKVSAICISFHPLTGVPRHFPPFSSLQWWLRKAQKVWGSSRAKRRWEGVCQTKLASRSETWVTDREVDGSGVD